MLDALLPVTGDAAPIDRVVARRQLALAWVASLPTSYAVMSALLAAAEHLPFSIPGGPSWVWVAWLGALPAAAVYAIVAFFWVRGRPILLLWPEVVWLGLLPAWGLGIDVSLPECDACTDANRALAWPAGLLVYALYAIGLAGWVASRVRRDWGRGEPAVLAALGVGVLVCGLLTVQFAPQLPAAVVFGPVGFPLLAPPAIALAWTVALLVRAVARTPASLAAAAASFAGFLTVSLATGWWRALTETCGWTLSTLEMPPQDCHYLCTVAAQGHPWLVRPLRQGVRRGRPIVVNRQLAVANAFEDLLHERWPAFGGRARRAYDRLGLPISRYLLHPVAADVVYVLMLPAQAGFELFLRLCDGDPEARIERMYR